MLGDFPGPWGIAASPVFSGGRVIQNCDAQGAAFLVAPDAVDNPYDGHQLPLPEKLQTHVVSLADGREQVALAGFDISWCQTPPRV